MRHWSTHEKLFQRPARPAELLIRQAHVLDPRTGIDGPHDVLIRDGEIAELGEPGALTADSRHHRATPTIEAAGKHLFPAFVDPHVHLRTPGQEYKENLETGTAGSRRRWLLPGDRDAEHRADDRPGERAAGR